MKRALLLGANSLLASRFLPFVQKQRELSLVTVARRSGWDHQIDPTDPRALAATLAETKPDFVLNFIGAADVDQCEADPTWARQGNVAVNRALRTALDAHPIPVVFISTDAVYDGPGANRENQPNPRNTYAETKLEGERALEGIPHIILRTNFFGRSRTSKMTTSDWWIQACRERKFVHVIEDSTFSAVHMETLSAGILQALRNPRTGIYNFGTNDVVKKMDFLFRLGEKLRLPLPPHDLRPANELPGRARRGVGLGMDSGLFARTFDFEPPSMEEEIEKTVQDDSRSDRS